MSALPASNAARRLPDQDAINADYADLTRIQRLLPVKITPFYRRKVEEEIAALGHTGGPLHRIVLPSAERLSVRGPVEHADFVQDRAAMAGHGSRNAGIVQKYPDRVLFMPTRTCVAHCQYCLRHDLLCDGESESTLDRRLDALIDHIRQRPGIREVILSGGDPVSLPLATLAHILRRLRRDVSVPFLRLHTRALVYAPTLFQRPALRALLKNADVRVVFHIVHPYEICDDVAEALDALRRDRIACYNQLPLLRMINDHADVLIALFERLDALDVRTLSLFAPDPVPYSGAFRLRVARIFQILDEITLRTPSWVHAVRFAFDTPIGKVGRENIRHYDPEDDTLIFERAGRTIRYPDFPAHLDVPGQRDILLWKGGV